MIQASTELKNIFYNSVNVEINSGCTIEYNMNQLIDNVSANYNTSLEAQYKKSPDGRINSFKKLFPIDSIIKPFRPINSGAKYYILLPNDHIGDNMFVDFKQVPYPNNRPRVYYPGVTTSYKYWVTPENGQVDATVTYSDGNTKMALTNKIVIKFEKYHTLPNTCSVIITKSDNSTINISSISVPSNGLVVLYYNGTSWSTTTPTEPISYATPISIKSINLITPSAGTGKVIGLIEISARWIKDISSDIIGFNIQKESSTGLNEILPVGWITSNNLNLNLVKYDQNNLKFITYNRDSEWPINPEIYTYLSKNVELSPYIKIYHSSGAITEGSHKYDKINQGVYYIDTHTISEYGDVSITALDGAKFLMETVVPDLVCQRMPVTSILTNLLDSVGFTNYNFNILSNQGISTDTSIPTLNYWWTDDTKTVWECIQDLCRDIQMNAFFDENNILQFYSRDYLYSQVDTDWEFYYEKTGNKMPNIITFDKTETASANQVKIIYKIPMSSVYTSGSKDLWSQPTSFLTAGGLMHEIQANTLAEDVAFWLDLETIDQYSILQSTFNYNGYFLVDSEIFEYDAIQFQYVLLNDDTNTPNYVWLTDEGSWQKFRAFSKTDPQFFKPTGKYRIKTRAALGTTASYHSATGNSVASGWLQYPLQEWL